MESSCSPEHADLCDEQHLKQLQETLDSSVVCCRCELDEAATLTLHCPIEDYMKLPINDLKAKIQEIWSVRASAETVRELRFAATGGRG